MAASEIERNRLKLQIEQTLTQLNRKVINPEIPELKLSDLEPIFLMVARARAAYLKELFKVTAIAGTGLPNESQIQELSEHRAMFEELRAASQALETALSAGYLDIEK